MALQAYLLLAHQGDPPGRPPPVLPGAGSGAQRPLGPDQIWRLQSEHGQVQLRGTVCQGALQHHLEQVRLPWGNRVHTASEFIRIS